MLPAPRQLVDPRTGNVVGGSGVIARGITGTGVMALIALAQRKQLADVLDELKLIRQAGQQIGRRLLARRPLAGMTLVLTLVASTLIFFYVRRWLVDLRGK